MELDFMCHEVLNDVDRLVDDEMSSFHRELLQESYIKDSVAIQNTIGETQVVKKQKSEYRWVKTRALRERHTERFQCWLNRAKVSWDLRQNEIDPKYVVSSQIEYPGPFNCSFMFCHVTSHDGNKSVICRECVQAKFCDIQNLQITDSCIVIRKWNKGSAKLLLNAFKYCEWCKDLMLFNKTSITS